MQSALEDRQRIADLMTGWIHRDLAEWDKLNDPTAVLARWSRQIEMLLGLKSENE